MKTSCNGMKIHRMHERKEGVVEEATEHIEEPVKVPHSDLTYGKMPSMSLRGKR